MGWKQKWRIEKRNRTRQNLVSVINLDEVLKYNPDFDYHINKPWTTTLVKNFKGTVQFVVEMECGIFNVKVIGNGVDKENGEPINFEGLQTGL